MTDPVFHADPGLLATAAAGDRLELTGPEAHHAITVRRLRPGETLDLVDGAGTRARCELLRGEKQTMTVTVRALHREPAPAPRLTLVQALAKGDRDLQAAESAPKPWTTLYTPRGSPACSKIPAHSDADSGVNSAGLSTTVLPVAIAGASFQDSSMNGVFHGVISPATPIGLRLT